MWVEAKEFGWHKVRGALGCRRAVLSPFAEAKVADLDPPFLRWLGLDEYVLQRATTVSSCAVRGNLEEGGY
jgi:hypothetical protein